jgi:integrase/recombinase XerD
LGRNPFGDYVGSYMDSVREVYSQETLKNRARRYKRMEGKIQLLVKEGKIKSMSPKNWTESDVREYILYCKTLVSTADMVHEINALRQLLLFIDNPAVDLCLAHNPMLKPKFKGTRRKDSMSDDMYDLILNRSRIIDTGDFHLVRAYALVLMAITTGTRNKEIRLANVEDVNTTLWTFDIIHVKGEATYGMPRTVPLHPDVREILTLYLILRKKWLVDNGVNSHALFPSKESEDGYLSGNAIRKIKETVEKDLNVKFDLRMCRRTFGQRYLDSDVDIESVSVLMGHASTKTTEGFYSRKRLNKAMDNARNSWLSKGGK